MQRGKQFTPESNETTKDNTVPEINISADAETKVKNTNPKVTLVKPLPAKSAAELVEEDKVEIELKNKSADNEKNQKNQNPRPKVGRPSATNKRKTEGKSKKKPHDDEVPMTSENKLKTEDVQTPSVVAQEFSSLNDLDVAPLVPKDDFIQKELPYEWSAEHARPWSFKSILFGVVLFILINIGFMVLFSVNHKPRTAASISAASVEPEMPVKAKEPVVAAPLNPPAQPAIVAPSPQIAAPAPPAMAATVPTAEPQPAIAAPVAVAPEQAPARNPQELLSIIDKN
jgi:hypothetical protein